MKASKMKVLIEGEDDGRSFLVLEREKDGSRLYYEGGVLYTHVDAAGASLLDYVSAMEAVLGAPASLLLLGTAGGALATLFSRRGAKVTAVDNWQTAFDIAHRWFKLPESVACVKADAIEFLRSTSEQWDAIAVDVYRGTEIPASMLTSDIGSLLAKALKPGGVIVWNVADGPESRPVRCIAGALRDSGLVPSMVSALDSNVGNTLVVCSSKRS